MNYLKLQAKYWLPEINKWIKDQGYASMDVNSVLRDMS